MTRRHSVAVLALFATLAQACSSETVAMWPAPPVHFMADAAVASAPSPVTPTDKERSLAEAYLKALSSSGFVDLAAIVDEQARVTLGARNTHGRERVIQIHEQTFGAFDQRHFVTNRVWLTDSTRPLDSQAFEWTMTGVQARDWMGIAPTLKPVVIKGLTLLWSNDNGVVSDMHVYFDEGLVRAQLGSGPAELQKLPAPSADAGTHDVFERTGAPEEKANVEVVRSMIQALEDDKEADFLSTMDDEVQVFTSDHAEPARGKNTARQYFHLLRGSIHHLDTVVENAWGAGSFAVVEYAITGLQQAPLPRVPFAAGRPLHTQFVDVAELKGGRMVRIWRYADPIAFAAM
jgi:ketosteroid isomerase-like protein